MAPIKKQEQSFEKGHEVGSFSPSDPWSQSQVDKVQRVIWIEQLLQLFPIYLRLLKEENIFDYLPLTNEQLPVYYFSSEVNPISPCHQQVNRQHVTISSNEGLKIKL